MVRIVFTTKWRRQYCEWCCSMCCFVLHGKCRRDCGLMCVVASMFAITCTSTPINEYSFRMYCSISYNCCFKMLARQFHELILISISTMYSCCTLLLVCITI